MSATQTRADDAEDTEGEEDLGTGLDSARARPTSVMELFRELEAQEEAASLAARLAERALSRKGSLKPAAGKDGPAAAKDGGGDEEAGPVRVEWAGKRRWEGTISKVKDIRGISAGLADVLQDDLPNCTPLELLRSFAGSKYVTCKQVRGAPPTPSLLVRQTIHLSVVPWDFVTLLPSSACGEVVLLRNYPKGPHLLAPTLYPPDAICMSTFHVTNSIPARRNRSVRTCRIGNVIRVLDTY